jgi:hypothetical protein
MKKKFAILSIVAPAAFGCVMMRYDKRVMIIPNLSGGGSSDIRVQDGIDKIYLE